MKFLTLLFLLVGIVACEQNADQKVASENNKTINLDSSKFDNYESNKPFKELSKCSFDNFLAENRVNKLAKEIYFDKNWDLKIESEALSLLDSLNSKNKNSRPFYFKILTKAYQKSDGYFSESLGLAGKEYIEKHTKEFLTNFENKECYSEVDLETWANIVMLEFNVNMDDKFEKQPIYKFINKLKFNCKDCIASEKATLNNFALKLENK
jgi:hypothetical protein